MPRNTIGDLHSRPMRSTFVRDWRLFRKLSQETLAERIGVTKATLSRIERGLQPYSQRILEALAAELGCSPSHLLIAPPGEEGPWDLWDALGPAQRRQALRVLRALAEGTEAA